MANSSQFNPKATYIARKEMTMAGEKYKVGDVFLNSGISTRKIKSLYETGFLWFPWQYEEIKEKQARKAAARKAKEESKKPKKAPKSKKTEKS
jgi:hypothetical protein